MSQAKDDHTRNTLSRRSAIALVGASGIAAATSTAIAAASTNPDADLLALGVQLEQIIREWKAQSAIDAADDVEWEATQNRLGIPVLDWSEMAKLSADEVQNKITNRLNIRKEHGPKDDDCDEHGVNRTWASILSRMNPLCEDILSRRATSVAGLGVQARAASLFFQEQWDPNLADDGPLHRSFIEAVCAFSGVVPVPVEEATQTGSSIPSPMMRAPDDPDPIFAAIEAYHEVDQIEANLCNELDAANTPEADAELDRISDAHKERFATLVSTKPTTRAGTVALLRYMAGFEAWLVANGSYHNPVKLKDGTASYTWPFLLLNTVAAALEDMGARS